MIHAGVSSLHNALGFSSPVILSAKIILQHLCCRKTWLDTVIPMILEMFELKMCLKPEGYKRVIFAGLHHFSDPSDYGVVSQWTSYNFMIIFSGLKAHLCLSTLIKKLWDSSFWNCKLRWLCVWMSEETSHNLYFSSVEDLLIAEAQALT